MFTCRLCEKEDGVVVCMMSVFILSQVTSMMTQVEWMVSKDGLIPLSCLAGNTLAIAVYIRLIRSSGLTLFSLCLLVLHEH